MRDPDRIDKVLESLSEIWKNNSQLRLMQLLLNCYNSLDKDPYYSEDEELIEKLNSIYRKGL